MLLLSALITLLGSSLNYNIITNDVISNWTNSTNPLGWQVWKFRLSLPEYNMFWVLAFPVLYLFYQKSLETMKRENNTIFSRKNITVWIPSLIFSIFTVIGWAFYYTNDYKILYADYVQILKFVIMFLGYFSLYAAVICTIFDRLDKYLYAKPKIQQPFQNNKSVWVKLNHQLERKPFIVSFVIIFIFWLPDIILKYPGILEPDSLDQILQYFHIPSGTVYTLDLANKNTYLNNFHPVVLTLIIGKCIELGRLLFHSDNSGLFLYIGLRLIIS